MRGLCRGGLAGGAQPGATRVFGATPTDGVAGDYNAPGGLYCDAVGNAECLAAWRTRQRRRQGGAAVLIVLALTVGGLGIESSSIARMLAFGVIGFLLMMGGLWLGMEEPPPDC